MTFAAVIGLKVFGVGLRQDDDVLHRVRSTMSGGRLPSGKERKAALKYSRNEFLYYSFIIIL